MQGAQSRHTKANLAKEPALFPRFRDTPCFVGHILSIQITKTKGEHTTGSLLLYWQTNIFSASYHYQPISSRRNSISFCCYLHHQFFNRLRLRAEHYKISAQQQALSVVCHPIGTQHSSLTQSMTLPTLPHAIFSTWQGTQNPDTKANLAKS